MALAPSLVVIEKNTFLTVVPEAEEVSETKSAPDLTMYQDLSFMEDAQLHGYSIGDEVQWMEQDECYLMMGKVVGESNWQPTWDACIMVRFKNQKYKVRVTSIAPRAMNPHRLARQHEAHAVLSAESDISVEDLSREYFEDGPVVFEIRHGSRGRRDLRGFKKVPRRIYSSKGIFPIGGMLFILNLWRVIVGPGFGSRNIFTDDCLIKALRRHKSRWNPRADRIGRCTTGIAY